MDVGEGLPNRDQLTVGQRQVGALEIGGVPGLGQPEGVDDPRPRVAERSQRTMLRHVPAIRADHEGVQEVEAASGCPAIADKPAQGGRNEFREVDAVPRHHVVKLRRTHHHRRRAEDQRASRAQGAHEIQVKDPEGERAHLAVHAGVGAQSVCLLPRDEAFDHAPVRDEDALGPSGRPRRVHHISKVVDRRAGPEVGRVIGGWEIVDPHHSCRGGRQPGRKIGRRDHRGDGRIRKCLLHPIHREAWIERDVGAAGLQHAEQRGRHVDGVG